MPPPVEVADPEASEGCGGGCVGGIIGGCFVPVLMCILWLSGVFTKYGCASPFAKKEPGVTMTGVEAAGGV